MKTTDLMAPRERAQEKIRTKTSQSTREMFPDAEGRVVEVPVSVFAEELDGGAKITTVVPNLGRSELLALRRRQKGGKPPLDMTQKRKLFNKRLRAKQEKNLGDSASVRTPEERLQALLAECSTVTEKRKIIETWKALYPDESSVSPAAATATQADPAPERRDVAWLYSRLMEIKTARTDGVIDAKVAAEQRLAAVKTFDVGTVPDREVLAAMTHGFLSPSRDLLTKQEYANFLGRAKPPAEPAPETPAPAAAPAGPVTMDPAQPVIGAGTGV